jgi:hypothetical protein
MNRRSKGVPAIMLVAFSHGLLGLLAGCPQEPSPSPEDGTLTVRVTGAAAQNGKAFHYAVGATGADLSNPANWIGNDPGSPPTIAGGTVECLTVFSSGGGTAIFSGGESYDVSGIIDVDDSGGLTSGDYLFLETFTVGGDMTVELVYPTDFTLY